MRLYSGHIGDLFYVRGRKTAARLLKIYEDGMVKMFDDEGIFYSNKRYLWPARYVRHLPSSKED